MQRCRIDIPKTNLVRADRDGESVANGIFSDEASVGHADHPSRALPRSFNWKMSRKCIRSLKKCG